MEGGEVCEEWEGSGRAEGVEVDGRGSGWNGVDGVSLSVIWGKRERAIEGIGVVVGSEGRKLGGGKGW